jgi:four helix bundle protein
MVSIPEILAIKPASLLGAKRVTSHKSNVKKNMEEKEIGYKKLIVWQESNELAYQVYLKTKQFPKEEIYGITSQLRRAALSIPTNLVESTGRQGKRELKQFVNIALGSLAETEYLIDFSLKLSYLNRDSYEELKKIRKKVGSLLWGFYESL